MHNVLCFSGLTRKLSTNETKKKKNEDPSIQEIAPKLVDSVTNHFSESVEQFKRVNWKTHGDAFVFKLLLNLATAIYFSNYAIYLRFNYDASPVAVGYVTSLLSATGAFCAYYVEYFNNQYREDNDFSARNKHVFSLLTVALIGMALAQNVSLYFTFVLPLAASTAIGRLVTLDMVLRKTNNDQRGSILNVANNFRSLSDIVAPLFVGITSELFGVSFVIYIAITLAAFGVYRSRQIKAVEANESKKK